MVANSRPLDARSTATGGLGFGFWRQSCLCFGIGILLLVSGCGGKSGREAEQLKRPPDPPEAVWLVVSGDTGGRLESCNCAGQRRGGLPQRAEILRQMRAKRPNLVLVDAGGNVPGAGLADKVRADLTFRAMAALRYDAVVVSKVDLIQNIASLVSASQQYSIPFVIANLRRTWGEYPQFWQTRRMIKRDGLSIGITGVATPAMSELGQPFALEDPVESVKREVEALRKQVDVVVVVSDGAIPQDNEPLAAVPGVDLIITGQEGMFPPSERKSQVRALSYEFESKGLGRIGLQMAEGKLRLGEPQDFPISSDGPEVPEIRLLVDEFHDLALADPAYATAAQGFLITHAAEKDKNNPYVGYEACVPCHATETQQWTATPHARAYAGLVKGNMQYHASCVVCHTTGFGRADGFHVKMPGDPLANVQCESCHGPGGNHVSKPGKGNIRRSDRALCEVCHNPTQSPKFKEHFEEYWRKTVHAREVARTTAPPDTASIRR